MSGYADSVISHHGLQERGILFLSKPFSVHKLTQKIREALDADPGR